MAKPVAHSPLAGAHPVKTDRYTQREIFPSGKIIVRGHSDDEKFTTAVKETLSLSVFPVAVNATAGGEKGDTLLGLSPTEWLLWTDDKHRQARLQSLATGLEKAPDDIHAAVVDVSDYYTIISISGELAKTVLADGCPLDLEQMKPGDCAQTRLSHANILIHQKNKTPTYDIQIRHSFAHYLWHHLSTAHHNEN